MFLQTVLTATLAFFADILHFDDTLAQAALTSSAKVLLIFLSFGLSTVYGSFSSSSNLRSPEWFILTDDAVDLNVELSISELDT